MEILMQRRIYPFLLMVVLLIGILSFQIRQFKRLYEHIKNDKYIFRPLFVLICVFLVLFFLKWHLSLQISGWTETCQLRTEIRKSELSPALQPCCRVDFCPLLSHYVMFQLFFFFFFRTTISFNLILMDSVSFLTFHFMPIKHGMCKFIKCIKATCWDVLRQEQAGCWKLEARFKAPVSLLCKLLPGNCTCVNILNADFVLRKTDVD